MPFKADPRLCSNSGSADWQSADRVGSAGLRPLTLPWLRVPRLASHLLGRIARRISADWQTLYAHPIHLLETFIDPARFRGTCYRAANWTCLGLTSGRGHNARTSRRDQPRKELWVYPLGGDFRARLGSECQE